MLYFIERCVHAIFYFEQSNRNQRGRQFTENDNRARGIITYRGIQYEVLYLHTRCCTRRNASGKSIRPNSPLSA